MAKKIKPRFVPRNSYRPTYEVDATYRELTTPSYMGIPTIEALPVRWDEDEWMRRLIKRPKYENSFRFTLDNIDRLHELENIKRFYQPIHTPLQLAIDMDIMIRSGYVDRNPLSADYVRERLKRIDDFDLDGIHDEFDDDGVTTSGIAVMAPSGMGKTRLVNRFLARLPQRVNHGIYKGRQLGFAQIPYLKFDCPPRGTIPELAVSFFYELDRVLGNDGHYLDKYMSGRGLDLPNLVVRMLSLATEHYLGLLIIDEVGNLVGAKEGRVLLNYLIKFSNEFRVPIVLIGTPKAEHLLIKQFSQMRRGYGYGPYNRWMQMKKSDSAWLVFVTALWPLQYLREFTPLTKDHQDTLHDVSGGITDLAVKMFIASQKRAIRNGMECITADLIRDAAREDFPWATEAVAALKLGTPQALRKYEDLYFQYVKSDSRTPSRYSAGAETSKDPTGLPTMPTSTGLEAADNVLNDKPKRSGQIRAKKERGCGLLRQIVAEGQMASKTAYEALSNAGWIADLSEYF